MTIEQLRQLEQAATGGTWQAGEQTKERGFYERLIRVADEVGASYYTGAFALDADAELIAAMRNALPALLDVAEVAEAIASDDYLEQPGPYATGIRREEAIALTEAVHALHQRGKKE